jgi:hypothetical protein
MVLVLLTAALPSVSNRSAAPVRTQQQDHGVSPSQVGDRKHKVRGNKRSKLYVRNISKTKPSEDG